MRTSSHWLIFAVLASLAPLARTRPPASTDVAIIGAGIGGLTAGAILSSKYRLQVDVFEAHYHVGGCAHAFDIRSKSSEATFKFDAGPTILLGCSRPPFNPLQQILNFLDASSSIDWIPYNSWGMITEEGKWAFELGEKAFFEGPLLRFGGQSAVDELQHLREACLPLVQGSVGIPSPSLRGDKFKILPLLRHWSALQKVIPYSDTLDGNFKPFMDKYVRNPWLRNWLDALAFSLSGLPASETGAAAMAYTLFDLHRSGSFLDYPRGGMGEIGKVLKEIITSNGGRVHLSSKVESIGIENNRASGVVLAKGEVVRARKAVLCNANIWALPRLLAKDASKLNSEQHRSLVEGSRQRSMTKSFLHLHLGIDSQGLNLKSMHPHYTVMSKGLVDPCADRNMVAVSNPSVLDSSLVDVDDKMVIHAYGAGNEPYELWAALRRGSADYNAKKMEASEYLFESVSRAIDIDVGELKQRAEVCMVGTPLTHERFLLRENGTYGAGWGSMLKDPLTSLPGLYLCGDSIFPGIGVPAVALSGSSAANSIVNVVTHMVELIKADAHC